MGSQLRLIFISSVAVLGALIPASSVAAPSSKYVHDVKVFHQVAGERSRPQPAEIALILGGRATGKLIPGLRGSGKQFVIADVRGGRTVMVRRTGPRARLAIDVTSTCRANPQVRYYLRAEVRIRGKLRKAFSRGDCGRVNRVLDDNTRAVMRTTFIFEN